MKKVVLVDVAYFLPVYYYGTIFVEYVINRVLHHNVESRAIQLNEDAFWISYDMLCNCTEYANSFDFSMNAIKLFGGDVKKFDLSKCSKEMKEIFEDTTIVSKAFINTLENTKSEDDIEVHLIGNCSLRERDILFNKVDRYLFDGVHLSCETGYNMYDDDIMNDVLNSLDYVGPVALKVCSVHFSDETCSFMQGRVCPTDIPVDVIQENISDEICMLATVY